MTKELNNINYIEEDEIDLKELFLTIWKKRYFILIFTSIVTIGVTIFVFLQKPVYEVKGFIEIGSFNGKVAENPNNTVKRVEILYKTVDKKKLPIVEKVAVVKNAQNLIELSINAYSNQDGKQKFQEILKDIKSKHQKIINDYIKKIKSLLTNLKKQKATLQNSKPFEGREKILYELGKEIESLELKLSPSNIKYTKLFGKMITHKYPIKPKKKLIVMVSFVTSLILSIFLVFFIDFIRSIKEEIKEEKIDKK